MGLADLARDAYYLTLAHTVNDGQVQNEEDLKEYTRLTVGTLWALAANEYEAGQWSRAAELFARLPDGSHDGHAAFFGKGGVSSRPIAITRREMPTRRRAFMRRPLEKHPFNVLAPEARLRLYHLYIMKGALQKAQEDLESLAWTVRTVWPKQETYWQKQTAQMLMAVNRKDAEVLPPLFQESQKLSSLKVKLGKKLSIIMMRLLDIRR